MKENLPGDSQENKMSLTCTEHAQMYHIYC